ncbi:uncharacterized protein LOC144742635 [Ciona intestinalis]
MNFKSPEGMLARWIAMLDTYNFEIIHRPGRDHGNADGLSRKKCGIEGCPECCPACNPNAGDCEYHINQLFISPVNVESTSDWLDSWGPDVIKNWQMEDDSIRRVIELKERDADSAEDIVEGPMLGSGVSWYCVQVSCIVALSMRIPKLCRS